jgi:hypothetical protein
MSDIKKELGFTKSIIALKIDMNRLGAIIEEKTRESAIYEFLIQQKKMLNS